MKPITRVSDLSCGTCFNGTNPEYWTSVNISGSGNVFANKKRVVRVSDIGLTSCTSNSISLALSGSSKVKINRKPVHRFGDVHSSNGSSGIIISGSNNVYVGG